MISRQAVLRRRDPATGAWPAPSGWAGNDLVLPAHSATGRYGDDVWAFPPDRPSGRPTVIDFGDDEMFPASEWRGLARDLAMALLGRRPGRSELARARMKPITVAQVVRRIGVLGRWADTTGQGLPNTWTTHTVDAFVAAYSASRLPIRVDESNPKSIAATRQTLAAYLNVVALLYEHRGQLAHGLTAPPWPGWPSIGAHHVAGVSVDVEAATEVIEPEVWWAAVRNALRILNDWAPDLIDAWSSFHAVAAEADGIGTHADIAAWAKETSNLLPVDRDGRPSWATVFGWCGLTGVRGGTTRLRPIADTMIAKGRTTRVWWRRPGTARRPAWVDHLDTRDLFSLIAVLRNAALTVLAALSAMRESELQELRRGCVEFHDGSWALRSTVQKQQRQPQPGVWWVTPVAVHAIEILEAIVAPIDVFTVAADGAHIPSDHLVCTLGRGNFGHAGLSPGTKEFERFTNWLDDHGAAFGLEPVNATITAHQFRRTFAVVAAWQPDGHVAVELQLKDTADVAAGYYANADRKWFEAYEFAKAEALASRLGSYNGIATELTGPSGPLMANRIAETNEIANSPNLSATEAFDARIQATAVSAANITNAEGWDCAGDPRHARCLALDGSTELLEDPTTRPSSGLCFDLGEAPQRACSNVVLDPAVHLAFWDLEAERIRSTLEELDTDRPLLRDRLVLELATAEACIDALEVACRRHPRRVAARFDDEHLRLIERLTDDRHAPGTAATYRPLIRAQRERIRWLATLPDESNEP